MDGVASAVDPCRSSRPHHSSKPQRAEPLLGQSAAHLGGSLLKRVLADNGTLGEWGRQLSSSKGHVPSSRWLRQRDLFPLPIEAKTQRALQAYLERGSMAPRAGGRRSSQAEAEAAGVEIWTGLQVIAFNFMATGYSGQPPRLCRSGASAAQARALARLRSRAVAFCQNDHLGEEVRRGGQVNRGRLATRIAVLATPGRP